MLMSGNLVRGSYDPWPPLNEKNIQGIWEGFDDQSANVIRLEVFSDGTALLARAGFAGTSLYVMKSMTIKSGTVSMQFRDPGTAFFMESSARRHENDPRGGMIADFTIRHNELPDLSFRISLYQIVGHRGDSYMASIWEMAKDARGAILKARKER